MKNKLTMLFMVSVCLLSACSTPIFKKPPYNAPSDDASIKLAEAANSVSDSMLKMARVEKTVNPPSTGNVHAIPDAPSLQTRASVDWSGPIGELTGRIAKAAHYKLRVLGESPSVPVLISLDVNNETLASILRNIDYQAGKKASIHVYPKLKVIELRYAKIYS
jgi:defect-in-organelle-trafficking protein DotD